MEIYFAILRSKIIIDINNSFQPQRTPKSTTICFEAFPESPLELHVVIVLRYNIGAQFHLGIIHKEDIDNIIVEITINRLTSSRFR
jgi:hypothetical protein